MLKELTAAWKHWKWRFSLSRGNCSENQKVKLFYFGPRIFCELKLAMFFDKESIKNSQLHLGGQTWFGNWIFISTSTSKYIEVNIFQKMQYQISLILFIQYCSKKNYLILYKRKWFLDIATWYSRAMHCCSGIPA